MNAIEVRGLRKTYPGGAEAVKGIEFDVAAGEVFGLLGPNGAGKSTTIGMLTTTIRPTSGTARLAGFDVAAEPLAARAVSSVVFQDPTVGLDPRIRHELLDAIGGLRDRETTILVTTHYLDEAERLCDRIAIMHAGRIVALDTPEELLAGLGGEILELRVNGEATRALMALRSHGIAAEDAFTLGSTLTVPLHERTGAQAIAALKGLALPTVAVGTREPTLDDVYLRLTGDRLAEAA